MASSTEKVISSAVSHIIKINPTSVLDIGIGFGKWGFLCREYLECWRNRVYPKDWVRLIDGVEIWKPFTELPWINTIYNKVYNNNIIDVIDSLNNYEMIIASDVIEHLPKEQGLILINKIINKSLKGCIINIPIGKGWLNNVVLDNNQYEKHQAIWEVDEIKELFKDKIFYDYYEWKGVRGKGGLFCCETCNY